MRELTFAEAIREALREEMQREKAVYLIGQDIGRHGGWFQVTKGLWEEFGDSRVIDTPISELAIIGSSVGAALMGMRPVAEIMYGDFMTLAVEHLVNSAAKLRYFYSGKKSVPLVVRTAFGGGNGGGAHHVQSFEAWFVHACGLKVVMPSTPADAKGLLKASIRDNNPVVFFEQRSLYDSLKGPVPDGDFVVPLGKADVKRRGKDVTLVATGAMVHRALEAAQELERTGIDVEVVDPRTLRPLDEETLLGSVDKTGRLVIVHEAWVTGGYGAEVAALVAEKAFSSLKAPIKRIGCVETPAPVSRVLEKEYLPSASKIVNAVMAVME